MGNIALTPPTTANAAGGQQQPQATPSNNFFDHATLQATAATDAQYLNLQFNDLLDTTYLEQLHTHAVTHKHVEAPTQWLLSKRQKLQQKLEQTEQLLSIPSDTHTTDNAEHTATSNLHSQIAKQYVKYLQRYVSELTSELDVTEDVWQSRVSLLTRSYLAYVRMLHRQELNGGKRSECTADDKRSYLNALLVHNNEKRWLMDYRQRVAKPVRQRTTSTPRLHSASSPASHAQSSTSPHASATPTSSSTSSIPTLPPMNLSSSTASSSTIPPTSPHLSSSTPTSSSSSSDSSAIAELLSHAEELPDLLGASGLLAELHPRETQAYIDAMLRRDAARPPAHPRGHNVLAGGGGGHPEDEDDFDDGDEEYEEEEESVETTMLGDVGLLVRSLAAGTSVPGIESMLADLEQSARQVSQSGRHPAPATQLRRQDFEHHHEEEEEDDEEDEESDEDDEDHDEDEDGDDQPIDDAEPEHEPEERDEPDESSTPVTAPTPAAAVATQPTVQPSASDDALDRAIRASLTEFEEEDSELAAALELSMQLQAAAESADADSSTAAQPQAADASQAAATGEIAAAASRDATSSSDATAASASAVDTAAAAAAATPATAPEAPVITEEDRMWARPTPPPEFGMSQDEWEMERVMQVSMRPHIQQLIDEEAAAARSAANVSRSASTSGATATPAPSPTASPPATSASATTSTSATPADVLTRARVRELSDMVDRVQRDAEALAARFAASELAGPTASSASSTTTSETTATPAETPAPSSSAPQPTAATPAAATDASPSATAASPATDPPVLTRLRSALTQIQQSLQQQRDTLSELSSSTDSAAFTNVTDGRITNIRTIVDTVERSISSISTHADVVLQSVNQQRQQPATTADGAAAVSPAAATLATTSATSTSATQTSGGSTPVTTTSTATPASLVTSMATLGVRPTVERRSASVAVDTLYPLTDADRQFKATKLLDLTLSEAIKVTNQQLSSEESAAAAAHPIFRLLALLQRDLFRKLLAFGSKLAANSKALNVEQELIAYTSQYLVRLLTASNAALVKAQESLRQQPAGSDELKRTMYHTLVGQALPAALMCCYSIIYKSSYHTIATRIQSPLQRTVTLLTQLSPLLESADHIAQYSKSLAVNDVTFVRRRVVESAHCYQNNLQESTQVEFAGSTHLVIEFDPRCSTTRDKDFLELYDGLGTPVVSAHGRNGWPATPLVVKGDRVTVNFKAEGLSSEPHYGYRLTVIGCRIPTPVVQLPLTDPNPAPVTESTTAAVSPQQPPSSATGSVEEKKSEGAARTTQPNAEKDKADVIRQAVEQSLRPSVTAPSSVDFKASELSQQTWILEVEDLSIRLLTRVNRLLTSAVNANDTAMEKVHSRWLPSPLFVAGQEPNYELDVMPAVTVTTAQELEVTQHVPKAVQVTTAEPTANQQTADIAQAQQRHTPSDTAAQGAEEVQVEHSHIKYIEEVQLTVGHGADAEFLLSFIEGQPHTAGSEFNKRMQQIVRPSALEARGGEIVKRTVRATIAALIKHSDLTAAARAYADGKQLNNDSGYHQLVAIFRKAQALHRWILSSRQAFQHDLSATTNVETDEVAAKQISYDYYCAPILNRAYLMLSLKTISSLTRQSSGDESSIKLLRSNSKSRGRTEPVNPQQQTLMRAWSEAKRSTISRRNTEFTSHTTGTISALPVDQILQFVQDNTISLHSFTALMKVHNHRAEHRIDALRSMQQMLHLSLRPANLYHILSQWTAFRPYSAYKHIDSEYEPPAGTHHMANIELASPALKLSVHQHFMDLYQQFTVQLLSPSLQPNHQALLLNVLTVDVEVLDHSLFTNSMFMQTVDKLCASSNESLRHTASSFKQLLLLNTCATTDAAVQTTATPTTSTDEDSGSSSDDEVSSGVAQLTLTRTMSTAYQPKLTPLQQQLVDFVLADVARKLHQLHTLQTDLQQSKVSDIQIEHQKPTSTQTRHYLIVERAAYSQLSLLLSISRRSKDLLHYVAAGNPWKHVVATTLAAVQHGTPRITRVALYLAIDLLRIGADSQVLDSEARAMASAAFPQQAINTFIDLLFYLTGRSLSSAVQSAFSYHPYMYDNGEAVANYGSIGLAALERLAEITSMARVVNSKMTESLQQFAAITNTSSIDSQYQSVLCNVLTTLSLLGGRNKCIAAGALVQLITNTASSAANTGSNEVGIVASVDRQSGRARCLFANASLRLVEVEYSQLKPMQHPRTALDQFTYSEQFWTTCEQLISRLMDENAEYWTSYETNKQKAADDQRLQAEAAKRAEQEEKKAQPPAPTSWCCTVCTYENDVKSRNCEMCSNPNSQPIATLKPAANNQQSAKQALQPVDPLSLIPTVPEPINDSTLLYHHVRSTALRSLAQVLQRSASSPSITSSQLLPVLLRLSARATELEGYNSIAQLESMQDRLVELIHQLKHHMPDEIAKYQQKARGIELQYTPLRHANVLIPSAPDFGTARNITFDSDSLSVVSFQYDQSNDSLVGVARSNHLVPATVPAYYYEVEIVEQGQPRDTSKSAFNIAVGYFRSGFALSQVPGQHSSYAYSARGELLYTEHSNVTYMPYNTGFQTGDVVGVGLNLRQNKLFITLNGRLVDPNNQTAEQSRATSAVNGRFYPCIWLEADGAKVDINYGQRPFRFDFNSVLPAGYEQQLIDEAARSGAGASAAPQRSAAEIRRRTAAEELVVMLGYPIELCEIALERVNDNSQLAAEYLIERGAAELQRLEQDAMRQSAAMAAAEADGAAAQQRGSANSGSVNEEVELQEWLLGAPVATQQQSRAGGSRGQPYLPMGWYVENGGAVGGGGGRRETSRKAFQDLLDNETETDIPVGIERREVETQQQAALQQRAGRPVTARANNRVGEVITADVLKLDDIAPGQLLAVMGNLATLASLHSTAVTSVKVDGIDSLSLERYANRVGVVSAINVNNRTVQLLFLDVDRRLKDCLWFPVATLTKPQRLWQDPAQDFRNADLKHIGELFIRNEQMLSVRRLRSSILQLFKQWPSDVPFTLSQLGGSSSVMSILKLAGSEYLSTVANRNRLNDSTDYSILDALKAHLVKIVTDECQQLQQQQQLPKLRIVELMYTSEQSETASTDDLAWLLVSPSMHSEPPFTVLLIEETILHFIQAVRQPPPVLQRESQHPYQSHVEVREKLQIPGASKLLVTFDDNSLIGADMLTRLIFYRDDQYQDVIVKCGHRPHDTNRFESFVVNGDKLYYRFTSGANTDHYGYKFKVVPVELKISDFRALKSLNMEMSAYLLELTLTYVTPAVKAHYLTELYNAIVWYVIHAKPAAKSRGVELLSRLLLHVHHMLTTTTDTTQHNLQLDFSKLQPLSTQMEAALDTMDQPTNIQSLALQGLVELMATADLVKKYVNKDCAPSALSTATSSSSSSAVEAVEEQKTDAQLGPAATDSKLIDISSLYVPRLRIAHAVYGAAGGDSELQREVTAELQKYVDQLGGTSLYIPASPQLLANIEAFATDPAPKRSDKRVLLTYDIVTTVYNRHRHCLEDIVLRQVVKTINLAPTGRHSTGTLIKADISVLDKIVALSGWSMQMTNKLSQHVVQIPEEVALTALRQDAIAASYYQLIPLAGKRLLPTERLGRPDAGYAGNTFTISFWLYLTGTANPAALQAQAEGRPAPAPVNKPVSPSSPMRYIISKGMKNAELATSGQHHRYTATSTLPGWSLHAWNSEDRLSFTLYVPYHGAQIMSTTSEIKVKQWTHVAVVVNRNVMRFVINGVDDAQKRVSYVRRYSADPFVIGRLPVGVSEYADNSTRNVSAEEDERSRVGIAGVIRDMRFHTHAVPTVHFGKHYKSISRAKAFDSGKEESTWELKDQHKICTASLQDIESRLTIASIPAEHRLTPAADSNIITLFQTAIETEHHQRSNAHQRDRGERGAEMQSMLDFQASSPQVALDAKTLSAYPLIAHLTAKDIRSRFTAIQHFNARIADVLTLIDFTQVTNSWSLAYRLSQLSSLIFREVKNEAWHRILRETAAGQSTPLLVSRPKAARALEKGETDGVRSVFGQVYQVLQFIPPVMLRCQYGDRPYRITYDGEGGTDAGGLFRDSLSHMCSELQSPVVPLFIPCPNARSSVGENQQTFVPNPASNNQLALSMLKFVGKLMGVAIRGGHVLNLDFPSLIWKPLVGQPLTMSDMQAIDFNVNDPITAIENAVAAGKPDEFTDRVSCNFACVGLNGSIVELKPNGGDISVTFDNYREFIQLYTDYKLHEVDAHVNAIKRGLATSVPISLLPLYTWQELESMVCGKREINIDYLKANTRCRSPVHSTDQHVQWLWKALEEMTPDQRQKFLRFTWGQSRLPSHEHEWPQKFEITAAASDNDGALPVSHTCFFSLELPRYSSYEKLFDKLLYACNHAISIDTDYNAGTDAWAGETNED